MRYLIFILFFGIIKFAMSQDLTRQEAIEKIIYLNGKVGEYHSYEPNELTLKTGKLYKLKLKNISDSKHYFSSNSFSKAIYTRKIQINSNGKKLAEVKGVINEIEVWPNHQVEWWFVPIKTGYFKDLFCRVLDQKSKLKHSEMGMHGTIIIE